MLGRSEAVGIRRIEAWLPACRIKAPGRCVVARDRRREGLPKVCCCEGVLLRRCVVAKVCRCSMSKRTVDVKMCP